ncbi:HAMP domain-containing sensor histidine kinase [Acetobacter sp. P1H12_c]|uniref:sensor histidine kinase n=1 Tax=Acetobacter sp. P1H12_c TaxID=2762621 RepID=UPI00207B4F0D|nr:histidine kinase dimerization/phospho-acceptor domain-containing protein [Acetobacter sp. P1H12_c]
MTSAPPLTSAHHPKPMAAELHSSGATPETPDPHTLPASAAKPARPWRLATRLIRGVTGVVVGCLAIVTLMTAGFTKYEITERLDDSLQEVGERLQFAVLALKQQAPGQDVAHLSDIKPTSLAYQITDTAGHVLLRSSNAPAQRFGVPLSGGFYMLPQFRVYVTPAAQTDRFILVGEPRLHRTQATHRAILIAVVPIIGSVPCIWLLVIWIVRRGLRPLVRLQDEIRERGSGNLTPVPELALPVELSAIQVAVNSLLERLQKALSAERAFAANAAHELRNPIAALLAQAQMLRAAAQDTSPASAAAEHTNTTPHNTPRPANTADTTQRLDTLISQIHRLSRTVEKLLQLSRAVAGTALRRDRFDLLPVLHVVADELDRPDHASPRIVIETGALNTLEVLGDLDAAGILLRNLLENALRYSPQGSAVQVHVTATAALPPCCHAEGPAPSGQAAVFEHGACVTIQNLCAPLAPDLLNRLTDPFVRGNASTEGSGLGLAIARTIARQMAIRMDLFSPIPGQNTGFMVQLTFQKAAGRL